MLAFSLSARAAVATRVATPATQRRGEFPRHHTGAFSGSRDQFFLRHGVRVWAMRSTPRGAGKRAFKATQTRPPIVWARESIDDGVFYP